MLTINLTNNAFHLPSQSWLAARCRIYHNVRRNICSSNEKFSTSEGGVGGFPIHDQNDLGASLVSLKEGGMQRTAGAWCILIGQCFTSHGVYNSQLGLTLVLPVSIALLAFGFALDYASKNPAE